MYIRKSRQYTVVLSLIAVLLTGSAPGAQTKSPRPVPRPVRLTILQLNDVYQAMPIDRGKSSGLARVATLRKQIMRDSPHTLFLLAGDTLSPSVASSVFKGEQMVAAWNAIGLDYSVLGNHEFDFGPDLLLQRMKESKFVWLGSNVIDRRTNKPFGGMPEYIIREFDGVKVGLLGLLTTDTETSSKPGPNVRFVNPYLTAQLVVRKMRRAGAQVIIAVTHLTMSEDKELARRVPQIDVIIGGHEHELLQSHAGRTPIFKWGSDARVLGKIDLNISKRTRRVESIDWAGIPVTDAIVDDASAANVIAEYEKKLNLQLSQPVGNTLVELDARTFPNRTRETNMGNLMADAFRQAVDADVALLNGGSVRAGMTFGPGPLTKRDMISIMPFGDPVVKIEVTGAVLKAALENGVSRIVEESESGRYPQISGMTFTFDGRKPAGSRVIETLIGNQPLEMQKKYTVAITPFLVDGGDGYTMFRGSRYIIDPEAGQIASTVLANFIAAAKNVSPNVEGRSKRLDIASMK